MSKHNSRRVGPHVNLKHAPQTASTTTSKLKKKSSVRQWRSSWIYAILFLVFTLALWISYGDVFYRTEQESYVSDAIVTMKPLTELTFGWLRYAGRYILLAMHLPIVGCALLSLFIMTTAWMVNLVLRIPSRFIAIAPTILSIGYIAWLAWAGFNIYFKEEPSTCMLIPMIAWMCVTPVAFVASLWRHKISKPLLSLCNVVPIIIGVLGIVVSMLYFKQWQLQSFFTCASLGLALTLWCILREACVPHTPLRSRLFLISTVASAALISAAAYALAFRNQNVVLTSRMQNLMWEGEWQEMVDCGLQAREPSRSVAAYYAIALEMQDRLLEELFNIPFYFPEPLLNKNSQSDEYGLLQPDCDYTAGLVNSSYHDCFEHIVVNGLRLRHLKRMAVCAVLMDQKELARKYMKLISRNPLEQAFVKKYEPMITNRSLVDSDTELAHVLSLKPHEEKFEQYYRKPTFLGYNIGLNQGSDATLRTSLAATLYSKDLKQSLLRAYAFLQKGWQLPQCMQEALLLYNINNPDDRILESFPKVNDYVARSLQQFVRDITPYAKDKEAQRVKLKDRWLGSYYYYYYCENNQPNQVRENTDAAGVN